MKVINLELLSWDGTIGGEHYYATLHFHEKNKYHRVDLLNVVTTKMADYLNAKEGCWGGWQKGDETKKFNTVNQAVKAAVNKCKEMGVEFDLILRGTGSIMGVRKALYGDKEIVKKLNKLYKEAEKINWRDKEMEALDEEFMKIIEGKS